jgi:ATPase subunit of ABC transporter with duplicated ATPase domains
MQNHLSASDLCYELPDGTSLFVSLNFSFGLTRTGLVGKNGIGKTTLLEILSGRKRPSRGAVVKSGRVSYLPQTVAPPADGSVGRALGISHILEALERIETGQVDPKELTSAENLWEMPEKIEEAFGRLGLSHISVSQPASSLSGGEFMRVRLAGLLLDDPEFLLLDEPTNHLDLSARAFVYELVAAWNKGNRGLVVVTHDRRLLSLVDQVADLDSKGLRIYGGDFAFYQQQRRIEQTAAEQALAGASIRLKKAQKAAQLARERQQKRNSAGTKKAIRTGISAMAAGNLRRAAENSGARLADRHQKKVEAARQEMQAARVSVSFETRITVDLESSRVPATRRIIEAYGVNYRYPGAKSTLWDTPLNLLVVGPERIHLRGDNGSGKSTLIDLVSGKKSPTDGRVKTGDIRIGVLDQKVGILDDSLTILENMKRMASRRPDHELRILLGRLLFYHDAALKPAAVLSGGERMRAGLACLLAADQAPELLILDEPTNNLDLASLESVVQAVREYRGTLMVVSHDLTFLDDIGIGRVLQLSIGGLSEAKSSLPINE